jgi:hypothetical protein
MPVDHDEWENMKDTLDAYLTNSEMVPRSLCKKSWFGSCVGEKAAEWGRRASDPDHCRILAPRATTQHWRPLARK